MKRDVGKLKQDMGHFFPIVVGLHRLMEEKGGDIRNLRKEFHENFAKGSDNLEALRSNMGDTVKVLSEATMVRGVASSKSSISAPNPQRPALIALRLPAVTGELTAQRILL